MSGLANCRYVAHQSDRQGQNAPKGYFARQEMTPEIAHIHIVASELKDPIWHSLEWQIGSFSSEATTWYMQTGYSM